MVSEDSRKPILSPLDQIRQGEADVIRRTAAAREVTEHKINDARSQVKMILSEAKEVGCHRGQMRFNEIISKAEEEAHAIVSQAQNQANRLHHKGKQRMSTAIHQAVNLIISLEEYEEDK